MPSRANLRVDAEPGTLRATRRLLHDMVLAHGAKEEDAAAVELAAGEVLINSFEHGYHGRPGPIEIGVVFNGRKVEITVGDRGESPTPAPVVPTSPPQGSRGRGLYLAARLMDEAEIICPWDAGRGVGVRMVKNFR